MPCLLAVPPPGVELLSSWISEPNPLMNVSISPLGDSHRGYIYMVDYISTPRFMKMKLETRQNRNSSLVTTTASS